MASAAGIGDPYRLDATASTAASSGLGARPEGHQGACVEDGGDRAALRHFRAEFLMLRVDLRFLDVAGRGQTLVDLGAALRQPDR